MAMLTTFSQPGYAGAVSAGMADVDSKFALSLNVLEANFLGAAVYKEHTDTVSMQPRSKQSKLVFQMSAHAQKAVCKGQDLHPAFPFLCLLPIEEHSHSALLQGSEQCHQGQPKEYEP